MSEMQRSINLVEHRIFNYEYGIWYTVRYMGNVKGLDKLVYAEDLINGDNIK